MSHLSQKRRNLGLKNLPSFHSVSEAQLTLWNRLKIQLNGFRHACVGADWSSQGREESDWLHHINFVATGGAVVIHAGKRLNMRSGHAYLAPGNTPMQRLAPGAMETFFVTFRCEWIDGMDPLLDHPNRRPIDLGAWDVKNQARRWSEGPMSIGEGLLLKARIFEAIATHFPEIEDIITRQRLSVSRFEIILKAIDKQLGADLRIDDLARLYGTSLHAFSMAFTRGMGCSPKAYINRKLHQKACSLLLETDHSIKQIAYSLRFGDEHYFSRFFKGINGRAPLHYRNLFENMQSGRAVLKE